MSYRIVVTRERHDVGRDNYSRWRGEALPPMCDVYEIPADDPLYSAILDRLRQIDAERAAANPTLPFL